MLIQRGLEDALTPQHESEVGKGQNILIWFSRFCTKARDVPTTSDGDDLHGLLYSLNLGCNFQEIDYTTARIRLKTRPNDDGSDGVDGSDGSDGIDGIDGVDGVDGSDASPHAASAGVQVETATHESAASLAAHSHALLGSDPWQLAMEHTHFTMLRARMEHTQHPPAASVIVGFTGRPQGMFPQGMFPQGMSPQLKLNVIDIKTDSDRAWGLAGAKTVITLVDELDEAHKYLLAIQSGRPAYVQYFRGAMINLYTMLPIRLLSEADSAELGALHFPDLPLTDETLVYLSPAPCGRLSSLLPPQTPPQSPPAPQYPGPGAGRVRLALRIMDAIRMQYKSIHEASGIWKWISNDVVPSRIEYFHKTNRVTSERGGRVNHQHMIRVQLADIETGFPVSHTSADVTDPETDAAPEQHIETETDIDFPGFPGSHTSAPDIDSPGSHTSADVDTDDRELAEHTTYVSSTKWDQLADNAAIYASTADQAQCNVARMFGMLLIELLDPEKLAPDIHRHPTPNSQTSQKEFVDAQLRSLQDQDQDHHKRLLRLFDTPTPMQFLYTLREPFVGDADVASPAQWIPLP